MSFMIWGCITYEGVSTLTVINVYINSEKYFEIVDNFVRHVIARPFPDDNYIYQDDNAPVHRARIVTEYLTKRNAWYGMAG